MLQKIRHNKQRRIKELYRLINREPQSKQRNQKAFYIETSITKKNNKKHNETLERTTSGGSSSVCEVSVLNYWQIILWI